MIKKIIKLKGIGRFYNYAASGDNLDLTKNSIFFAPNGYGKSTLVSVLKSLSDNSTELVAERKTLDKSINQEVVISVDGGTWNFQNGNWINNSSSGMKLLFFDKQYIHDNLFVQEVTSDHKKAIHEIVVGNEGVKLKRELEVAKRIEREKNQEIIALKQELVRRINESGIKNYLSMYKDQKAGYEQELSDLKKRLKGFEDKDKIIKLHKPKQATAILPLIINENLLSQTIEDTHEIAKRTVEDHLIENCSNSENAISFIRQGMAQKKTNCPFCGRELISVEGLLTAYKHYFDDSYEQLQKKIESELKRFQGLKLVDDIRTRQLEFKEVANAINNWKPYISGLTTFQVDISWNELLPIISGCLEKCINELENKSKDLKGLLDISKFTELNKQLNNIKNSIEKNNEKISEVIRVIDAYLASIENADEKATIQKRIEKLRKILNRFSREEVEWCSSYYKTEQNVKKASKNREEKEKALGEYSKELFSSYEADINKLLIKLGTNFQLCSFRPQTDFRANSAFVDFKLYLNDREVPLQQGRTPQPCFKNTLSEGDKNALAFAFFIVYANKRSDLSGTIIVFDDPLSSLDDGRRLQVANIISELSGKSEQTLSMTHKKDFLYFLYDKYQGAKNVLDIKADNTNGSSIVPFDINHDRLDQQHKRILLLERYQHEDTGDSIDKIQGEIRKLLETALQFKYFKYLSGIITLGPIIDELAKLAKIDSHITERLHELNNISSPTHHGESGSQPLQELSRDELLPEIGKALALAEEV